MKFKNASEKGLKMKNQEHVSIKIVNFLKKFKEIGDPYTEKEILHPGSIPNEHPGSVHYPLPLASFLLPINKSKSTFIHKKLFPSPRSLSKIKKQ